MSENSNEGGSIKLTPIESEQAFKPGRSASPDKVLPIVKEISSDVSLYKEVSSNPYSPSALHLMAERFSDAVPEDRVRAVVFAEPEGDYDKQFHAASLERKQEMLYDQIDSSAEIAVRLEKYLTENKDTIWDATPEQLFENFTQAAFETIDRQKIEERYAQSQRRGFRLATVNFIEDLSLFKDYKEKFGHDKLATVHEILGHTMEGTVNAEVLPYGIVIYLNKKDFEKVLGPNDTSKGRVLKGSMVPPELSLKVAIVNRDLIAELGEDQEEYAEHELKHVIYHGFFDEALPEPSQKGDEEGKYLDFAKKLFLSMAKDEVITHVANNNLHAELGQMHGYNWHKFLNAVEQDLRQEDTLTMEDKAYKYSLYHTKMVEVAEKIRTYQWVQRKLLDAAEKGENGLTKEKVEALLRFTPVEKAGRLGKYFGVEVSDFSIEQQKDEQLLQEAFEQKMSSIIKETEAKDPDPFYDPQEMRSELPNMMQFVTEHPKAAVQVLLQTFSNTNNIYIQVYNISFLKRIIENEGKFMRKEDLNSIKDAINTKYSQIGEGNQALLKSNVEGLVQTIDNLHVDFALEVA